MAITLKFTHNVCLREERNQTQVLRQQQDEAYLASLRADQEKDRKKREVEEQQRQEEEKVRQTALAEERRRRVSLCLKPLNVCNTSRHCLLNVCTGAFKKKIEYCGKVHFFIP